LLRRLVRFDVSAGVILRYNNTSAAASQRRGRCGWSAVAMHQMSPQMQATKIVGFGLKKSPIVRRVNVVGRFATVLTSGGVIGSTPFTVPILFERFSFGWQALLPIQSDCDLAIRGLSKAAESRLERGMPAPKHDQDCERTDADKTDAGPPRQVEAVRSLMRGTAFVPWVVVSGRWAILDWFAAPGGQKLYHLSDGRWRLVVEDGGAMGIDEMRRYHVPRADWCAFGIPAATCR